ncbi:unnamed protein product, partial [Rotaria sp. Silwood2]
VRPISFFRIPLYASGEKTVKAPIFVNDVSNAIYAAIREPMSVGQTYEIYGPERYKLRELIEYCLRYMRRKKKKIILFITKKEKFLNKILHLEKWYAINPSLC